MKTWIKNIQRNIRDLCSTYVFIKIVFSHRKSPFNNFNPFLRDTIGKMARFPADITGNDLGGKANFEPTDLETS